MGREQQIEEVERELAMTRLLTLTGVGGSGKTRLSLEVARGLVEAYPDGVWLVELAPLSEEVLVPKAVAEALKVTERPGEALSDTLAEILRDRQLLLILDNCEHLLEASARLVDKLLDSCPNLRILATSREALGLDGEIRRVVTPLSVPDLQHMLSLEQLEACESVRLFVERARGRDSTFSLSPHNEKVVAEICSRLEGIPLAIELAAARVGTLSIEQISQRLTDSLKLLTGGSRTKLPRQRTLRGALDWSYELLSEEEKELFERSSVFAGGWTLEAAEAVGKGEGIEQGEVLDVLSGLAEKSLVVARGSEQGDVRYKMLEPIRQYAVEKLEEGGEAEEARHRHATFFLALAEAAEPRLRGPEDTIWLALLEAEHDNLRTALSWALGRGEIEIGLRLAGALYRLWDAHGHYREGTRWLERALEKNVGVSGAARAKALERFGWLVYRTGGMARAVAAGEEGLELSHQAGLGGAVTADLLRLLGWMAWTKGDYGGAKGLLEESLALSRSANDRFGVADSLLMLGSTVGNLGDHKRDKQLHEEAVALCRELGYSSTLATSLFSMGYGLLVDGDYERGEALIEESAALYRERGYKGGLQFAVDNLGWAALLQGEHERARISYRESLTLCKELGDKMIASESLDGLACISAAEGEAERAAILFGAGEALFEAVGGQHEPGEAAMRQPYLAMARSRLDEIAWQEAWEEGRGMSMEEAIEYAFSTEEPFATPPSSTTEQASAPEPEHLAGLTSREVEVLGLVAAGMTSVQIAENLFLSPRTVNTHINSIYHKIGVNSRAAATRFALEHGLA